MSYTPPGIQVNQTAVQQQPTISPASVTRIGALFNAPHGPDMPVVLDPSQLVSVYGDPSNPANTGYTGMDVIRFLTSQTPEGKVNSLQLVPMRYGVTRAVAAVLDGSSGTPFSVAGIGAYAGSAGNSLQVVVNAPQVSVIEVQKGNSVQPEIQQIIVYGLGGSPTGGFTLSFNGTPAAAATTATTWLGGAAGVQTYITGITTVGAGNATVTAITVPQVGAVGYQITFAGTLDTGAEPLFGVSAITLAGGTGATQVQNIQVQKVVGGVTTLLQQISAGVYDLSSAQSIYSAINQQNPTSSASSVIQAITLAATPLLPKAQTVSLAGGADGLGTAPGTLDVMSPDGTTKTIPYLLQASLDAALGGIDLLVVGADAGAVMSSVQTHIASALSVNQFRIALLGPAAGTTYSALTTSYQTANSDRVLILGHDVLTSINPTNGILNASAPGYAVAAGIAAIKGQMSPEENLYHVPIAGVSAVTPRPPDLSTPLTVSQLNTLAGAGYTVLEYSAQTGRMVIRDLISTAPQVSGTNAPNRFMYLSERHAFDAIARLLIAALSPLVGTPALAPAQVIPLFQGVANTAMQSCSGTLHNGATATVTYDPVSLIVTVNVGYADRPPMNTIILNITPQATLAATAA